MQHVISSVLMTLSVVSFFIGLVIWLLSHRTSGEAGVIILLGGIFMLGGAAGMVLATVAFFVLR